jgi:hypothetical protein
MRSVGRTSGLSFGMLRLLRAGVLAVGVAGGCDRHKPIAGGYEFIVAPDMGVDGHPAAALGFHGKKVWQALDFHTFEYCRDAATFVHEDVIVFLMTVPDEDEDHYRYEVSPQLCAMRGGSPPVMLSERILGHPIRTTDDGIVCKLVPSAAGVHVEFGPGPEPDASRATGTHDIPWSQIVLWLDAGQSAPLIVKPLGTYRVLPPEGQASSDFATPPPNEDDPMIRRAPRRHR